jgi:branched-subunit amino acid aminotransferase/4-amino-4-deoxychorismate lyase
MILINGQAFPDAEAYIAVTSPGFQHGFGAFETIKVRRGRPVFLADHQKRLQEALDTLQLAPAADLAALADQCALLLQMNGLSDGLIKLICCRNRQGETDMILLTGRKVYASEYERGLRVCLASGRRNEFSRLSRIKSLNYAENILEKEAAVRQGFAEAIFLNTRGFLCEGCTSNLFWIRDGHVLSPDLTCGLLPGIARRKVIDLCHRLGRPVTLGEFPLIDLQQADEIFLTNALMDIMPVSALAGRNFAPAEQPITRSLMAAFAEYYQSR